MDLSSARSVLQGMMLPPPSSLHAVGRFRHNPLLLGLSMSDVFVGHKAKEKCGILSLKYPVERSVILNWEDIEALWRHALHKQLHVCCS